MAHAYQDRFSALVAAKLNATLATKDNYVFNTFYEGTPTAGAVKIPVRSTNPTVNTYDKTTLGNNAITYGSTAYITATLRNDKFVNEYIDGYEAAAVPDGIVADRLSSAGYALAASEDEDAITVLKNAVGGKDPAGNNYGSSDPRYQKTGTAKPMAALGTANSGDRLNAETVYAWVAFMGKTLSAKNVPMQGRWLLVDPEVYSLLLQCDKFIRYGDMSQEMKNSGAIGMCGGFAIYMSNRLGKGTDITISGTAYYGVVGMIAGHPDYCTRVDEWQVVPKLVDLNGDMNVVGGSAIKGRWVFTHEVTAPEAFAMLTYPVAK